MKVGLIDVDSRLPNLALMKISSWHKRQGDITSLAFKLNIGLFDLLYASSIFKDSEKSIVPKECQFRGGPGFNNDSLPPAIEQCQPDYSLFPGCNFSWQRFSKGCIRHCPFCLVPHIEGYIRPVEPMNINPRGRYIYLLDSNFFASPNWKESIEMLKNYDQPVQFEGIDIRIVTEDMLNELYRVKLKGRAHIAWDFPGERIDLLIKEKIPVKKRYKFMCYVLVGYSSTHDQNMFRVQKLSDLGIDPYVMPYDRTDDYQVAFTRWVNRRLYKTVTWGEYKYYG